MNIGCKILPDPHGRPEKHPCEVAAQIGPIYLVLPPVHYDNVATRTLAQTMYPFAVIIREEFIPYADL